MNYLKKKVFTLAVAGALAAAPFSSLATAAESFVSNAYIEGYQGGFSPEKDVSRGELAKMIGDMLSYNSGKSSFSDVADSHWAKGYIGVLSAKDIIDGYSDNTFRPDNSISRAELATILDRVYKNETGDKGGSKTSLFRDIRRHWAEASIKNMERLKILDGYGDGTYRPDDTLSKEESVKAINKLARIIHSRGKRDPRIRFELKTNFNDVSSDRWSYEEVIEASVSYNYTVSKEQEKLIGAVDPKNDNRLESYPSEDENVEAMIGTLNAKRDIQGLEPLAADPKLSELAKKVSELDASRSQQDSTSDEEIESLVSGLGIPSDTELVRGSILVKTGSEESRATAASAINEILLAAQYLSSIDKVGVGYTVDQNTQQTSWVIYMGLKNGTEIIDQIVDSEIAQDIYDSAQ